MMFLIVSMLMQKHQIATIGNIMLRKIKKVIGVAMLSTMLFSMAGNITVLANNWMDTEFSFDFSNAQLYTDARLKLDTSKVYMKCESIKNSISYTAHAVGCNSTTGDVVDCSRGYTYTFASAGTYHYMTSWVYRDIAFLGSELYIMYFWRYQSNSSPRYCQRGIERNG